MRKVLVVLCLAGAVAGAFAAPSASASLLCTTNVSGCSAENVYESGEWLTLAANGTKNLTIATSSGSVVCQAEAFGKVTEVGGEGKVAKGEITSLGIGSCVFNNELPCGGLPPTTAVNLPYNAAFEGSGGSGTTNVSDPTGVGFAVNCWTIGCTLTASSVNFEFTGGSQALLAVKNAPLTPGGGGSCPATASLTAQFKTTTAAYIVGGAAPGPVVRLCTFNADPCGTVFGNFGARHPIGSTLEASVEGTSVFEFNYEGKAREPACEESVLTGKTTTAGKPLLGEVSALSFKKCGGGVCAVEAQNLAYKAEIEKTSGGNGTLTLVSNGSGGPKIDVNCGGAFKCVFKATSVSLAVTGGKPAKLVASGAFEKDAASEAECGSTMTWKATYKLTKPTGAVYVTS